MSLGDFSFHIPSWAFYGQSHQTTITYFNAERPRCDNVRSSAAQRSVCIVLRRHRMESKLALLHRPQLFSRSPRVSAAVRISLCYQRSTARVIYSFLFYTRKHAFHQESCFSGRATETPRWGERVAQPTLSRSSGASQCLQRPGSFKAERRYRFATTNPPTPRANTGGSEVLSASFLKSLLTAAIVRLFSTQSAT